MARTTKEFLAELGIRVSISEAANTITFSNNLSLSNTSGIKANNSFGTSGQVLTTNGSAIYWGSGGGAGGVNTAAEYTWTNNHIFLDNMVINSAAAAVGLSVDTSRSNNFAAISATGNLTAIRSSLSDNSATTRISHSNTTSGKSYSVYGDSGAYFAKDLELGEGIVANGVQGNAGEILTSDGTKVYWASAAISVNTTAKYIWANTHQFLADVTLDGINANGSVGNPGQFLSSDGSKVYWTSGGGANVNTAADYTWTNNHTFLDNVVINSSAAAYGLSVDSSRSNFFGIFAKASNSAAISAQGDFSAIRTNLSNNSVTTNISYFDPTSNKVYSVYGDAGAYFGKDVILGEGIVANGTQGTAGQVLTTDGNKVYWGTGGGAGGVNTAASYTWTNSHIFQANASFGAAATVGQRIVDITTPDGYIPIVRGDTNAGWQFQTESGGTKKAAIYLAGDNIYFGTSDASITSTQLIANKRVYMTLQDGGISTEIFTAHKNQFNPSLGVLINKPDGPTQLGTLTVGSANDGSGIAVKMNNKDKYMYTGTDGDGTYKFGVNFEGGVFSTGLMVNKNDPTYNPERDVDITLSRNGYIPIIRGDQDSGWQFQTESGGTRKSSIYMSGQNGGTLSINAADNVPRLQMVTNDEFAVYTAGGNSKMFRVYRNQGGLTDGITINRGDSGPFQLGTLSIDSDGGGGGVSVKMNNDDKVMFVGCNRSSDPKFYVNGGGRVHAVEFLNDIPALTEVATSEYPIGLEELKNISPLLFKNKDGNSSVTYDVKSLASIAPHVISYEIPPGAEEKEARFNVSTTIGLLINAVKELSEKVEVLEGRLKTKK